MANVWGSVLCEAVALNRFIICKGAIGCLGHQRAT